MRRFTRPTFFSEDFFVIFSSIQSVFCHCVYMSPGCKDYRSINIFETEESESSLIRNSYNYHFSVAVIAIPPLCA